MNKRFGRLAAIVLTVAMILSAFPLITLVSAAPVYVKNANEYREAVNDNSLNSDVVIEITADFEIGGGTEASFSGTINGNGHVITVSSQTALFNEIKATATIKDLGVVVDTERPITAPANSTAYCGVLANVISGTVKNCFVYGAINVTYSITGDSFVGGLCGSLTETGTISNSFSCVSINADNTTYIGGFAGIVREGGRISSCYSAGDIKASSGFVAGFANSVVSNYTGDDPTITDTYTSCQIVNLSNDALPSGVNGIYDNQLSLMREGVEDNGLSTKELLEMPSLSDNFVVTSTAYPALQVFYDEQWSKTALDVVDVSTAAAIFSDVNEASRQEPPEVLTRADYLSHESYVDRTNVDSLSWSITASANELSICKIYDTVPTTSLGSVNTFGTTADLLRARLSFTADATSTQMVATKNGFSRIWHLRAYNTNPYFNGGNGTQTSSFLISNKNELNNVRFYSLITNACYTVANDFPVGEFDPIVGFIGTFDGNEKTLSGITLADDREGDMGLFADTREGSIVQNLVLSGVTAETAHEKSAGMLIGSAVGTTVSNIVIKGVSNTAESKLITGGVIGTATNSVLSKLLVSVEADGVTVGGLVGTLNDGSLTESGVTGLVGGSATTLGGLVGKASGTASISNCYSTAAVLSNTAEATAAGLVGVLEGNASLTTSYSAALSAVKDSNNLWTEAYPLVGSGEAGDGCSYDGQFYNDDESVISVTDTAVWLSSDGHTPQLSHFKDRELSSVSTVAFIHQHYWADDNANDMTTGWIPDTFAIPTVADDFCGVEDVQIYTVETTAGYGFEPASGIRFAAVRTEGSVGVRYAAVIRDDLIPLRYTVTFASEEFKNTPVFLELSYSKDGSMWSETQVRALSDDSADDAVLYDIPKGCFIRVRVWTQDNTAVLSVFANELSIAADDNGCYTSAAIDETVEKIDLVVTLREATPTWGVHRVTM